MPLSVQTVLLKGCEPQTVTFPGQVIDAQAVLQGWIGKRPKVLLRTAVSWEGDTVTVTLTELPFSQLVEILVIAQVDEDYFPATASIKVFWNKGKLKVKPHMLEIKVPTTITWRASRKDPCNIVGIYGLPDHEFGRAASFQTGKKKARLTWTCPNRASTKMKYRYSILAERNGRVAFLDPQIINEPDRAR